MYSLFGEPQLSDWDYWLQRISEFYKIIEITVNGIKAIRKIRKIIRKEYTITEIHEKMQTGELHFGDKISVLGTFSEYLPFIDPKFLYANDKWQRLPKTLPRTARLESINDIHCGALFELYREDAFSQEVIPIFYGNNSSILNRFTGDMLKIDARISKVPYDYLKIINQGESFKFEKEEGLNIPFGLDVLEADLYGLIDTFKVNSWIVGNLNPSPKLNKEKKNCLTCRHGFAYMPIDPIDWPMKVGCLNYKSQNTDTSDELKKATEDFLRLEERGISFINFPNVFSHFEVFCPKVDIINDDERKKAITLLIGAIKENIEGLFGFPGAIFLEEDDAEIPEKMNVNVDFQFDQMNRITKQEFDPSLVKEWICPHYKPKPNGVTN